MCEKLKQRARKLSSTLLWATIEELMCARNLLFLKNIHRDINLLLFHSIPHTQICTLYPSKNNTSSPPHQSYYFQVWSPAGGWWPTPVAWKRNTTICAFTVCFISSVIFKISAEKERRPIAPYKHIPSQRWCKHAKEDDPSLP